MALIPLNQQFHTQSGDVDTSNKGSRLANADRKSFTMQDIIDTAGLSGTNNVYIASDGTPKENGVALLKGYEEAKTKVSTILSSKQYPIATTIWVGADQGLPYGVWSVGKFLPFLPLPYIPEAGYTYTGTAIIENGGVNEMIVLTAVVEAGGSGIPAPSADGFAVRYYKEDGTELVGTGGSGSPAPFPALNNTGGFAAGLVPIEVPVAANLIVEAGIYEIEQEWILDGEYVNVTSSTGQADVIIQGANIDIQAGNLNNGFNTYINGLSTLMTSNPGNIDYTDTGLFSIFIGADKTRLVVSNCKSYGWNAFSIKPGNTGQLTHEIMDCEGGFYSFGQGVGNGNYARYYRCKGFDYSFGHQNNNENARYYNCESNQYSFGNQALSVAAEYYFCKGAVFCFGSSADAILTSAVFYACNALTSSFGSGCFNNECQRFEYCTGTGSCFQGNTTGAIPKYYSCKGTDQSFVNGAGAIENKELYNCILDVSGGVTNVTDGGLVFNTVASQWAALGTGKLVNCLAKFTWTSVTLP
jgi:hypothetical protein